ncbi:MAG TPA: alpha/beta hydrolase [Amycolatopsis sp.]|nr:alpha/beta hydrolase [Amycolatopsis sp.]
MTYQVFDVDVSGGSLRVGRWGEGPTILYGAHGLTANHRTFAGLAAVLGPEYSLIAPDLRGRGGSARLTGTPGLDAHAADAVAVLDHLGVAQATFVGHALGGFVATVTAAKYPDRVARLVLADGGLPFGPRPGPGTSIEDLVRRSVGGVLDRLAMTFPSAETYLDTWRRHPAVGPYWNDVVEDAYRYDLTGTAPSLRPGTTAASVLADCAGQIEGCDAAAEALTRPVTLLWAERGVADQVPGLYTEEWLMRWRARLPRLRTIRAGRQNHLMLLMGETGARLIASILNGPESTGDTLTQKERRCESE